MSLGALRPCNRERARMTMDETRSTADATDHGEGTCPTFGETTAALGSWLDESIRVRPYTARAVAAILGLALGSMSRR